jgi:hypothetical protein
MQAGSEVGVALTEQMRVAARAAQRSSVLVGDRNARLSFVVARQAAMALSASYTAVAYLLI